MEPNALLDWILGGLALAIALSGLWMLVGGILKMNDKP